MPGKSWPDRKQLLRIVLPAAVLVMLAFACWRICLAPTRILVINATLAQQADMALNNDSRHIRHRFLLPGDAESESRRVLSLYA